MYFLLSANYREYNVGILMIVQVKIIPVTKTVISKIVLGKYKNIFYLPLNLTNMASVIKLMYTFSDKYK